MSTSAEEILRRHRLNVDEYHRMAEAGILGPDARVELIEGEIIDMAPIGSRHAAVVRQLAHILHQNVGYQAIVSTQNPVRLDEYSEPEPDLALLRPRDDFYATAHPGPGDILLIIEVADTSLRYDREIKIPLYARHGIPEVWLVDLVNERLLRFLEPGPDGYRTEEDVTGTARIHPTRLPKIETDLSTLFRQ